ncbi:MAG: glycoside hydrolase family 3 N-terminal domain-containing protein [Caldilineaceae bacterium]
MRRLPSRRGILFAISAALTIGGAARPGSMPHAVYAQDPQPSPERPVTTPSPVLTTTQTISSTATSSPTSTVSPSPTPTMTPSVTPTLTPSVTPSMTPSVTAGEVITFATPLTLTTPTITGTVTPPVPSGTVLITATIWAKASATAQAAATVQAADALTLTPTPSPTPVPGPDDILDQQINEMIARMSVADRVGQLFVIDFQGGTADPNSDIAELIQEYRVGGVVLNPQNDNFRNDDPNAPRQIAILTNQLQGLAYDIVLPEAQALDPPEVLLNQSAGVNLNPLQQTSPRLPLLIGVEQSGDGYPGSSLRSGFTNLPPEMALGATWSPDLAQSVGAIVGRELAAVGVNMLIGPSLDVLDQPRPDPAGGLGIFSFGGDAFWVGKMGQAYVTGVHDGGNGRVATIAGHFPGQGGSDRRPDEEVATIQKSLQELRHTELQPFAAVTQRASSLLRFDGDPAATDGLMSGHVRYSSFQGSRERTPPISLATELETILALDEFAIWRAQGGVVMSDALGVPSIRRYYDPTLTEFPRRRVALEAFQAGNDLLYLANFSLDGDWEDARTNIRETILFFRERYTSDPEFAARVDRSLLHILRLKVRMYDTPPTAEDVPADAETPVPTPTSSPTATPGIPTTASLATTPVADATQTATPLPEPTAEPTTEPTPQPTPLRAIDIPIQQVLTGSRALRILTGASREEAHSVAGQVARGGDHPRPIREPGRSTAPGATGRRADRHLHRQPHLPRMRGLPATACPRSRRPGPGDAAAVRPRCHQSDSGGATAKPHL